MAERRIHEEMESRILLPLAKWGHDCESFDRDADSEACYSSFYGIDYTHKWVSE
jgi:hypothetical protein